MSAHHHDEVRGPSILALLVAGIVLAGILIVIRPKEGFKSASYTGEEIHFAQIVEAPAESGPLEGVGQLLMVRLDDGQTVVEAYNYLPRPTPGERVFLQQYQSGEPGVATEYVVVERDRTTALLIAGAALAILLLIVSRRKGAAALYGLVGSWPLFSLI